MLRRYVMFSCSVVLLALFASAQGRAVNISNTWVLPEEGFPVFYRYFRDRISWYEADAVCQFHHANLVTVDTTAQYDAVRAYLKELDISSAVWVGLIRSNPDGDFTWTDYRGLSGDGYWSSAPDARAAPLCAAANPAADYRWEARACGGPMVASFICELPVPQWALGNQGCMVRALPALTVLYLPESAAVQLTADCGLAGTKRVQCTGNVKREDLLNNLSCAEDEDASSTPSVLSVSSTWIVTTDTGYTDQDVTNDVTTEENITTEHESEEKQSIVLTTFAPVSEKPPSKQQIIVNKLNILYSQKNNDLDLIHNNNLQSNDIPKLAHNENFLTIEQTEKLEDEKNMHHKMLHDELARHGNFETIFTQPTDHFVPPLVMAKSKISDDMTVLSLAEKHAQQLAEQRFTKHNSQEERNDHVDSNRTILKSTTEKPNELDLIEKSSTTTKHLLKVKDYIKKDKVKSGIPKKYKEKYDDPKGKNVKIIDGKLLKFEKPTESSVTSTELTSKATGPTTVSITESAKSKPELEEDLSIDLTVMLKELGMENSRAPHFSESANLSEINTTLNDKSTNNPVPEIVTKEKAAKKHEIIAETQTDGMKKVTMNHEVIKITIINDNEHSTNPTPIVYEITTKMPHFLGSDNKNSLLPVTQQSTEYVAENHDKITTHLISNETTNGADTTSGDLLTTSVRYATSSKSNVNYENQNFVSNGSSMSTTEGTLTTKLENLTEGTTVPNNNPIKSSDMTEATTTTVNSVHTSSKSIIDMSINHTLSSVSDNENNSTVYLEEVNNRKQNNETPTTTDSEYGTTKENIDVFNYTSFHDDEYSKNWTDSSETIDDFQSPLLSAANEPLHRPNRSRRPQHQNRITKFNPFRILG